MAVIDDAIRSLLRWALHLGYPGVFLLSLVSNLIVFVPVPYLLSVFFLSAHTEINVVLLSLISGLGAACGKLIVFTVSRSGRKLVNEKSLHNLEFARMIMERYGFMAVFIIAATPLPDDIFYIPMGIAKFTFIKFFLACLAGKFLLTLVVALGGRYSISWIRGLIGPESLLGVIVTILFIAGSVYLTIKINWEAIFVKYFLPKKKLPKKE
jgi:membrane protein DedA with SNARE-associated domain